MVAKNKLLAYTAICSIFLSSLANAAEIERNTAKMQAMDKITGRVSVIEVPVGGEVAFGSFSIVVRSCKATPPEETPENYAFVDVADSSFGKIQFNIFKGWMMSSSPALNAVEHPIYDIWLLKCIDTSVDKTMLLSDEKIKEREELPKLADIKQESVTSKADTTMPNTPNVAENVVTVSEEMQETALDSHINPAAAQEIAVTPEVLQQTQSGPKSLLNIANDTDPVLLPVQDETESLNISTESVLNEPPPVKQEEMQVPLLLSPPEIPNIPEIESPEVISEPVEASDINQPVVVSSDGSSVESLPEDEEDQFIDLSAEADSTAALEAELSAEALKDK